MIIGLCGTAGVGKSTIAEILEEKGFHRAGFAERLRDLAFKVDPIVYVENPVSRFYKNFVKLSTLIDDIGYREAKKCPTVREFYQNLGQGCREIFGNSCWVDLLHLDGDLVLDDVRYQNEAHAIIEAGGRIWKVTRQDVKPPNNHESEQGIPDDLIDGYLTNDCTLEELPNLIKNALGFLGYESKNN